MDTAGDSRSAQWTAPGCPFAIEYDVPVLDDVRLAVMDAFFSMPRGGVEIGGILLGDYRSGRVSILNSVPLECEHALGPSFMLSTADLSKLGLQLAALPAGGNARPVGWYHSHTRSGIFLSETDLEIHRRFFPEPWQVALVLKPHTLEPVRAGFFFRDATGAVQASASCREFLLEALPVRPIPGAQPARSAAAPRRTPILEQGPVLETTVVDSTLVEPAPAAEAAPAEAPPSRPPAAAGVPPAPDAPPSQSGEPQVFGRWPSLVATILGLALGAGGYAAYQKRGVWWPRAGAMPPATAAQAARPTAGLSAIDAGEQLQIRWDRDTPAVRGANGAVLTITDGDRGPQIIRLDQSHLEAGTFTYGRQTGHVDVALTIHRPDGSEIREVTTFLGPPPLSRAQSRRNALAEEAARLKRDLNKQAERTRQLEKTVREMRMEMQKRMAAQVPDSGKK